MCDTISGLEIAKIGTAVATPIIVLVLGIWAKNIAVDYERRASLSGKIIEKRVTIYELIDEDLNDIYVFLIQVGNWKDLLPQQVVQKKRTVDKIMYKSRPYWSDAAFTSYVKFMSAAFETYTGVGENAKIRTETVQFEKLPNWDKSWATWFSSKSTAPIELRDTYNNLMKQFATEFGYFQENRTLP